MKRKNKLIMSRIHLVLLFICIFFPAYQDINASVIKITGDKNQTVNPLDTVELYFQNTGKYFKVSDGKGNEYVEKQFVTNNNYFVAGAALGLHTAVLYDKKDCCIEQLFFEVDAKTAINDKGGKYKALLDNLYFSMIGEWGREASILKYNNKYYHVFVRWLRDHVHTMKGMKYFYPVLHSGIDLYADTQRDDGMIFDNYYQRDTSGSYWKQRFEYGGFYMPINDKRAEMKRIPVENDVEYLFIEGLYYTWKATGDNQWMKSKLDNALKAIEYSTNDPYRWSKKYKLLKRGFTIDTWDFQCSRDADISTGPDHFADPMVIKLPYTRFGVMFGDNTGFAVACEYLAEMLTVAGRNHKAKEINELGQNIRKRINELSWNGEYYTHHIPEDTSIKRELGVDPGKQVSLSNAYSLNRAIGHKKAKAIIETYRRIKNNMPESSPGEWYTIYPPFEKGFGGHNAKWSYMNGGVTTIVAGELAHGAFEHGYEAYGVDILNRIYDLSLKTNGYLNCTYRGKMPERPKTSFTPLSLQKIANADFKGDTKEGVMGWTNEGVNDLHEFPTGKQVFHDIPFAIIAPAENNRRACLGISSAKGYKISEKLPVNQKAKSIYFLHTTQNTYFTGTIHLEYNDGTTFSDHIGRGKILNWWYPGEPKNGKQMPRIKVAWRGKNAKSDNIGITLYGLNNPNPDKTIKNIRFEGVNNHAVKWMICGVTLSDQPVFFMPDIVSAGIPDNWGAAAVVYALVEGLAGVKDNGTSYQQTLLSPRWQAAGVNKVNAVIKYPASGGYVAYNYHFNNSKNTLELHFTGTSEKTTVNILLPQAHKTIQKLLINGTPAKYKLSRIENSEYLVTEVKGKGVYRMVIGFN